MNTEEKLRTILNNLKNKEDDLEIEPNAFHLRELLPTIKPDLRDIDELEVWEYKIGEDILKINWELEDITDDIIRIYLNGEKVYAAWNEYSDSNYIEYDDDAEDLFLLIMQYGGGVLQPQKELDYIEEYFKIRYDNEISEKRNNRREFFWKI